MLKQFQRFGLLQEYTEELERERIVRGPLQQSFAWSRINLKTKSRFGEITNGDDSTKHKSELVHLWPAKFSQPASEEPASKYWTTKMMNDISEYLTGDDDELSQNKPAGLTQRQPRRTNTKCVNVSLIEERLIALEPRKLVKQTKSSCRDGRDRVRANDERTRMVVGNKL